MGNQFAQVDSLSRFIENSDLTSALKLIQEGADPNELNPSGKSCLRLALEQGNSQLFRILHQIGGRIIPPLTSETALHFAVRNSHSKLVRLFLRNSQSFPNYKNSKDIDGRTPLHLAAHTGNVELVAMLLKYNCNKNILDISNKSAKDLAIETCSKHLAEILELLGSEELRVQSPQPLKKHQKSPHNRRFSSKSTVFSSTTEPDLKPDFLEVALSDARVPVIGSSELRFGEVISRGSSCKVYKGFWRGTEIAIKQFKIEYSTSLKETHKFIKEMNILSETRHPNLLMLMGVCIDQPHLCIISELVPNCSLFQALYKAQKPLSLDARLKIAIQIAQGLAYLHTNQPPIIHRDLKPENCLVRYI